MKNSVFRGKSTPSDTKLTVRTEQQLPSADEADEAEADLSRLIEQMESLCWRNVSGISTPEAAAFVSRLIDAREKTRTARLDEARTAAQTEAQEGE